jgi:hypothetical protein
MKLLLKQFSLFSCYTLFLGSKQCVHFAGPITFRCAVVFVSKLNLARRLGAGRNIRLNIGAV